MQPMQWSMQQIKQCEKETGQAMLSDEHSLAFYSQDFGKLKRSTPSAICIPHSLEAVQAILAYANQHYLPVTIRGKGLSQGGQSLASEGGLTLQFERFDKVLEHEKEAIWIEANSSWSDLLAFSLKKAQIPYVLPYNCNLSIAGVLSAGGIGAASFKYGSISSHVRALEVITVSGECVQVDAKDKLFSSCLSGQGRFAAISKACIELRPCLKKVRTFFLAYLDKDQWLDDLGKAKEEADYIEAFCSPAILGAKLRGERRSPFAEWLFALHFSVEYEDRAPDLMKTLSPWKILEVQDESIASYLHRHDSRFEMMKMTGQWDLHHPWYECFIPVSVLTDKLDELLSFLPIHYASLVHVVPVARQRQTGFLMLPEAEDLCSLMVLNPGVHPALLTSCLQAVEALDSLFLSQGGKRYLSGYLGADLSENYWQQHFGLYYEDWLHLKKEYDPRFVLNSSLFPGLN